MARPSANKAQPRTTRSDRKPSPGNVNQEQLAADIAAFRKAGGKIEVLGNTQTLKKIGVT